MIKKCLKVLLVSVLTLCYWAVALTSCSAVSPYVIPAVMCAGQQITGAVVTSVINDITSKNWADLETIGKTVGWATLSCIIDQVVQANTGLKTNADEFRTLHAVEFRSAQ